MDPKQVYDTPLPPSAIRWITPTGSDEAHFWTSCAGGANTAACGYVFKASDNHFKRRDEKKCADCVRVKIENGIGYGEG